MGDMKKCLCHEGYEKNVYVMGEICETEVYVMRDMKKCLCDGRDM